MIVDTSAVIAVLLDEPERGRMVDALLSAPVVRISEATYVETGVVIDGPRDPVLSRKLDGFMEEFAIEPIAVDRRQAGIARQAYRDFGKGSGHPARLNFGDCCSYALAVALGEPLLFKGDDFGHTDVRKAL